MGLEWSAFAAASHIALVVTAALVFLRSEWLTRGQTGQIGLALAVSALIVERLYYVTARLLKPHGLDLWSAHPAPELLSAGLAFAIYAAIALPRLVAGPEFRRQVTLETIGLIWLWLVAAKVLW